MTSTTSKKKTHCESCGEWLDGFDACSECGSINLCEKL